MGNSSCPALKNLYNKAKGELEDFNKVLKLNPKTSIRDVFYYRSKSKKELKDYEGAKEDLNKGIKLNSKNALAYIVRGQAKFELKDYQGAKSDLEKVLKLNPDNKEIKEKIEEVKKKL